MDGISHAVKVTAGTLYEAVAQGLVAIRGNEWVAGIAQGLNVIKVSVADIRVVHEVKTWGILRSGWERTGGGSPREVGDRHKIRSILCANLSVGNLSNRPLPLRFSPCININWI